MSGKIPVGEMSVDMTLNGSQPVRTLRELKQAVTNTISAWKAQRAEMNSVGKTTEAAKAKYDGLKTTIEKQKEYISGLSREQKQLVEAQKNVDRSTKEGKVEYGKYGEQIAKTEGQLKKAEIRLTSLTTQQSKAKQSLNYYESGLAKLQRDYKESSESSRIYISRLKEEHNLFGSSQAKLNSYRSGIANLTEQLKKQEVELKRIENESGKTSEAYRQQENRVNRTGLSLAELRNKQKDVRAEFNKFHPTGIAVADKAITSLRQNTNKLSDSLKSTISNFKNTAIAASAGIAATGAFAWKGAEKASNLQKSLTENTNLLITSGEKARDVTKEVSEMQKDGRKYSIQYAQSQDSIAKGYQELIKRGYDGKQSLGAMKAILQASKASGDDFADTMQVTTSVLEAFGMRTKSTAGMLRNTRIVANKLAMAADATSTDFKSLGVGMNYVGTSAKTAGVSLTETASAMGVLSNSGLEAQQAGTGLRKILISLQTPSKNGADALRKYGLSVDDFKTKSGKLKPIAKIFQEIADHVPKADRSNFFHNVFGTTGQNAAAILATNTKELERVNKQVAGAYKNDYVGKLANKNMKATKNQQKQFHEAMEAVQIDIGTAMMPALSKASTAMVKVFNRPSTMKGIEKIANGIGTIANKVADLINWLGKGNHIEVVSNIGKKMLEAFAGYKLLKGIVSVKRTLSDLFSGTLLGKRNQDLYNESLAVTNKLLKENAALKSALNKADNGSSIGAELGTAAIEKVGAKDAEKYVTGVSKNILNSKGKVKFRALFQNGTKIAEESGSGAGLGWARKLVGKIGDARLLGKTKWAKIFRPASKAAEEIGTSSGKGLISRFLPIAKNGFGKVAGVAALAFDAVDIFKGLTSGPGKKRQQAKGKTVGAVLGGGIGAALGSVVPGIGTAAGATLGASLGTSFGGKLPALWKQLKAGFNSFGKWFNKDFLGGLSRNWNSFTAGISNPKAGGKSNNFWTQLGTLILPRNAQNMENARKGIAKGWSNFWNDDSGKKKKSPKLSATDEKVMASAMDVSKKSISNVKSMSKALKDYAKNLGAVKSTIKKNDPSKELNKVSDALSKHEKTWGRLSKDIKPIGDAFKYLATFAKSMAKVDAFKELTKDLPNLEKSLSKSKKGIIGGLKDLSKAFGSKSSGIYSKVKDIAKQFDNLDTKIYHLNKKLSDTTKDFKEIGKISKQFTNKKNNPFENMAKGLDKLRKSLKADAKDISKYISQLTKSLVKPQVKGTKSSSFISELKSLKKPLNDVAKDIQKIGKYIKPVTTGFKAMAKVTSKVKKLESSIKSLSNTLKKNKFGKQIADQIDKANKAFTKKGKKQTFVVQLEDAFKSLEKSLKEFKKTYNKDWADLWDNAPKKVDKSMTKSKDNQADGLKHLINTFESGAKKYNAHFNSWLNYLEKDFKKVFESSIPGYAKAGMNKMISTINSATSGVNNVIKSFGGNSNVISKIHLATGTGFFSSQRKAITKPTMAVLNDGHDSPETGNREAIYRPSTGQLGIVNGINVPALLHPGDEVLNATETKMLGLVPFASGTGYLKKLYDQAKAYNKQPIKTLDNIFKLTDSAKGAMKALVEGSLKKMGKQSVDWWSQLWQMADNKINDGGSPSALLDAVKKYGEGHAYHWGSEGPELFDCSGLVKYALKKAFGINYDHFSGAQYAASQHISKAQAHSGDLVFWGPGGSEHVGVYAGGNKYFSAESPSAGIHMNTLDSVVGKGSPLFARVKVLKEDSTPKVKTNSALEKKIKVQVGSGFWKTISKIAEQFGEHMADPAGDGVARWKATVIKALKANGFNATPFQVQSWLRVIARESNGNPKAINTWDSNAKAGIPSKGLAQVVPPTFDLYKQNAHANIWNGYDNLYAAINYMKHAYGSNSAAFSRVAGGAYANGGLSITEKLAHISEGNKPEMIVPLVPTKATRAWELIGKAVGILSAQSGFKNQPIIDTKEAEEEHEFRHSVLQLLERIATKDNSANITLTTPEGRTLWQTVEPFYKEDQRAAQIKQRRGLSGNF